MPDTLPPLAWFVWTRTARGGAAPSLWSDDPAGNRNDTLSERLFVHKLTDEDRAAYDVHCFAGKALALSPLAFCAERFADKVPASNVGSGEKICLDGLTASEPVIKP